MHIIKTHLLDYTHKLLESYLYNRVFAVRCNTKTSDDYIIEAGVPQGSALGPNLLFSGYSFERSANNIYVRWGHCNSCGLRCPGRATTQLANRLLVVESIKINEQKCKHITFTLSAYWIVSRFPKSLKYGISASTLRRHIDRKNVHLILKSSSFHWVCGWTIWFCSTTPLWSPSGQAPSYGGTRAAAT